MAADLDSLLHYCVSNGRICPGPHHWNKLWKLLRERGRGTGGLEPPAPKILSAWSATNDREKSICLEEQVHWANQHGALDQVDTYLRGLFADDWHFVGNWQMTGGPMQPSSINADQVDAYRMTEYRIGGDASGIIRIGQICPMLDTLLDKFDQQGAAFITAYNPYSQLLSAKTNQRRQEALRAECESNSWQVIDGTGCDPNEEWPVEASVLVVGPPRAVAEELGRKFEQHAIVWIERRRPAELVLLSPLEENVSIPEEFVVSRQPDR